MNVGYSVPLTITFLESNQGLTVDTAHFGEKFRNRLVASIDNLDAQVSGLPIHSNNIPATALMANRHNGKVDTVYNDPRIGTDTVLCDNIYSVSHALGAIRPKPVCKSVGFSNEGTVAKAALYGT